MGLGSAIQKLLSNGIGSVDPSSSDEKRERDLLVAHAMRDRAAELAERAGVSKDKAAATVLARETLFLERAGLALKEAFKGGVKVTPYKPKSKSKTKRVLNLLWSDLHFHALLDPRELPLAYGPTEEARRLAELCVQAANYKRDHRDETELTVNIAGDIIQNHLHDQRDGAPLADQWSAALYLLTQAIAFLATEFKKVTVNCVPGNHGRDTARHRERATNQKWDSLENTLYYALQVAFANQPNVSFNIPYTPHVIYNVFGKNILVTHGDTFFKPGNPGSSIDVNGIANQINKFNAGRHDKDKVSVFAVGHVHTGSMVRLAGDVVFISNSALIPIDSFAQSIGIYDTSCGQQMWESTEGHVVGDSRYIVVDESVDKNSDLDKIIKPFSGFSSVPRRP